MKILLVVMCLYIFSPLSFGHEFSAKCENGILISGKNDNAVTTFSFFDNFIFNNEMPVVRGEIIVSNTTELELSFGTKMLQASFNSAEFVRTYKQTIASEMINIATTIIKANSTREIEVYWVPKLPIETIISHVRVNCASVT